MAYSIFFTGHGLLNWSWWPAKITADIIGWSGNYASQRFWAFDHVSLRQRELQHAFRYAILMMVNFGIDYAIVGSLNSAGLTPYLGFFFSAAFFIIWNYVWFRFAIFPQRSSKTKTRRKRKNAPNFKTDQEAI
ncbi:MAG: GtrA family protein [Candidatus Saccharimonadales bacterium]